jgi:hypothetical protein
MRALTRVHKKRRKRDRRQFRTYIPGWKRLEISLTSPITATLLEAFLAVAAFVVIRQRPAAMLLETSSVEHLAHLLLDFGLPLADLLQ